MNIKLYKNSSEANVVDKELELVAEYEATLRDKCSVSNPVILLQFDEDVTLPADFNYCTIRQFARDYYVEDVTLVTNSLYEITLRVDVLSSFKNDIRASKGIVARASKKGVWNSFINDGSAVLYQNEYILKRVGQLKGFDYNNKSYVLAVAGGN